GCWAMNASATGVMERLEAVQPVCTMMLLAGGGAQVTITSPFSALAMASDGAAGPAAAADIVPSNSRAAIRAAAIHCNPFIIVDKLSGWYKNNHRAKGAAFVTSS